MSMQRIETYKDGVLVDVQEVEVPDPPSDPLQEFLDEVKSVNTVTVNALRRYLQATEQ